jgi:hypothetical protein
MEEKRISIIKPVTSRGTTIKVPIPGIERSILELKMQRKVLFGGLKSSNPRQEVNSVVIHISLLA